MLALRFAALLGLVFWVGGLAALGIVAAPAIFDVVGAGGASGRALAGATFGEAFARFNTASYISGAVVLLSLAIRGLLGPRPRHFAVRVFTVVVMLAATAWTGFVLIPRIQEAQRTFATPSHLPGQDPRRPDFGRLHGLASALQLVPLAGGLVLIFFELKD
jgi:hypothetical protein